MLDKIRGALGRRPPAVPPAAPEPLSPTALLLAVRADRRLRPLDYASLADAIVAEIRDQIGSGWMLARHLEQYIGSYLRDTGLDPETLDRTELRRAIRARRDVTYTQKVRIKTDMRFDELRGWIRLEYKHRQDELARLINDKVAVYHVSGTADASRDGRDEPAALGARVRAERPQPGPRSGLDPVRRPVPLKTRTIRDVAAQAVESARHDRPTRRAA